MDFVRFRVKQIWVCIQIFILYWVKTNRLGFDRHVHNIEDINNCRKADMQQETDKQSILLVTLYSRECQTKKIFSVHRV